MLALEPRHVSIEGRPFYRHPDGRIRPAIIGAEAATRPGRARNAVAQVPVVPFASASHEHTEPGFDTTVTPGAAAVQLGPFDVPAHGYIRNLHLEITASGGALGAGVLSADYPWNLIESVTFQDVNGAPIVGPIGGYELLQANIWGGYGGGRQDPRSLPWFDGTINADFPLRLPIEISRRDGVGSLANQNAAAAYKVLIRINPSATLFSTAPTTIPAFRIRGSLEAWTLPNDFDVAGRPQAQLPPAHGTTQYWSFFQRDVSLGSNTVMLPRVGNLLRAIIVIARTSAGARQDNVFADPAELVWDARSLRRDSQNYIIQRMAESVPDLTARDTGVFAYLFNNSDHGQVGDDSPQFWLQTVQSTRMEIDGSSGAAGRWTVLTNDIAPAEVVPAERFVETSDTGFHPQIGVAGQAVQ